MVVVGIWRGWRYGVSHTAAVADAAEGAWGGPVDALTSAAAGRASGRRASRGVGGRASAGRDRKSACNEAKIYPA